VQLVRYCDGNLDKDKRTTRSQVLGGGPTLLESISTKFPRSKSKRKAARSPSTNCGRSEGIKDRPSSRSRIRGVEDKGDNGDGAHKRDDEAGMSDGKSQQVSYQEHRADLGLMIRRPGSHCGSRCCSGQLPVTQRRQLFLFNLAKVSAMGAASHEQPRDR